MTQYCTFKFVASFHREGVRHNAKLIVSSKVVSSKITPCNCCAVILNLGEGGIKNRAGHKLPPVFTPRSLYSCY